MLLPETLKLHDQTEFEFHYIYFLPWKDQMVEALRQNGGIVSCIKANNNFQLMLQASEVAKYAREHNIKLIHAHLPWAGILGRIVGKLTGIPVIYTEHNKQERYHFATRMANLFTMGWLTKVIAVSQDVAESIRKHKPGLNAPLVTLLNGVNVEHFSPERLSQSEVRERFAIPVDSPVIGTIAVFRFQKRLDLWIKLARKIHAKNPATRFIIVGDGPLKSTVMETIKSENLEGIVHLAGLQTEVRPFLAAMDIYMMSSIFEGLPIALLEAMASGCSIITTDAGGVKEVVRNRLDGLVCHVDDPEKLIDFADELISNIKWRQELGRNARQRVVETFSISTMVEALEQTYRKVLH